MYSRFATCAVLLLPLTVLLIATVKGANIWRQTLATQPWWIKVGAVIALFVVSIIGGVKPGPQPPAEILEMLTLRSDGSLGDLSGRVVSGVQAKALVDYVAESSNIVQAADTIIAQARIDTIGLTNQLLSLDYDIGYLSLDLPRGTPADTNHNIMIAFQRVEQSADTLDALVWFSEMSETNVNVFVEYSLAEGIWESLPAITNYYPATETVDGVECIRYRYAIPDHIAGTPLKPNYEITFGGWQAGQYLSVPEQGIVVSTNGVNCLPYTGWDDYSSGLDTVLVRYIGGIAVEAITNGVTIKGGIN